MGSDAVSPGLTKVFGGFTAVDQISFEVKQGDPG
jgi:ABC-type branched-subunit amino acid transport system ATPase component